MAIEKIKILGAILDKESSKTYLIELTPYKGLWIVVCLLNGHLS